MKKDCDRAPVERPVRQLDALQAEWREFIDAKYKAFLSENYQMDLDAFCVDFPWNPTAGIDRWREKRKEWEGILAVAAREWWQKHGYTAEFKGLQGKIKKAA